MHARCSDPDHQNYENYGGRGIRVCKRWECFDAFHEDMGDRPVGHTLDRINSEDSYYPLNCRWETEAIQANNRRNTVYVEYQGEATTVGLLGRRFGISTRLLWNRIKRDGWPVERAVHTPARRYSRRTT